MIQLARPLNGIFIVYAFNIVLPPGHTARGIKKIESILRRIHVPGV